MGMKLLISVLSLLLCMSVQAQDGKHGKIKVRKDIPIEDYVDIEFVPAYSFGILSEVIKQNIRYPKDMKAAGREGFVDVLTIIDESGQIVWTAAAQSSHKSFEKEALRVLRGLSTFEPTQVRGEVRKVRTTIRVEFSL